MDQAYEFAILLDRHPVGNRGAIINHYSNNCWDMCGGSNSTTAMTDNNGNLKKQEVYIPNDDQISGYEQLCTVL